MPTVHLNKKVLESLVGKKLSLEKLKDRISYLGTDLDGIKGDQISVEVFPNRPDMLSEQGFARALSSFIGVKTGLRKYNVKKSGYKVIVDSSVKMRPYTACAIIRNVKFTNERIIEVMHMQEKLATTHGRGRKKSAYGVYPTDNVTFPIRYTTRDPRKIMFQPLGFEEKMLAIKTEEVHPTAPKYKHIADSWRKQGYTKYPFFIDSKENVMCMLPYTNSHDTGKVDESTKEVFIECTGTDLNNVNHALNIFVTMFADMGGDIYSLDIEYPNKTIATPDLKPSKMKVDHKYVNKRLGLTLSDKEFKKYLERMGFGYEKGEVIVPAYRTDIMHQVDLVEDIAIAYGYENFQEEIPNVATIGQEDKFEIFKRKIAESLIGFELIEASTFHLINEKDLIENSLLETNYIELEKASSSEYNILRTWLLPSLLQVLRTNKHHEYPQNLFEIGIVFNKDKNTESGIKETSKLSMILCQKESSFTQAKQILDYLMNSLGVKCSVKAAKHPSFIEGRCAEVKIGKTTIGTLGELNPQLLSNFTLEMPAAAFEIDLRKVFKIVNG